MTETQIAPARERDRGAVRRAVTEQEIMSQPGAVRLLLGSLDDRDQEMGELSAELRQVRRQRYVLLARMKLVAGRAQDRPGGMELVHAGVDLVELDHYLKRVQPELVRKLANLLERGR
jgi:hypothetical protein